MDPWIYFWLKAHFFINPCKNDPHIGVLAAFSGALAGLVAILVVLFFTGFLYYLPEPILAVLIIAAVINMVDFRGFLRIWSVGRITGCICHQIFRSITSGQLSFKTIRPAQCSRLTRNGQLSAARIMISKLIPMARLTSISGRRLLSAKRTTGCKRFQEKDGTFYSASMVRSSRGSIRRGVPVRLSSSCERKI